MKMKLPAGLVVGEIETPKVAEEGIGRIEVHPHLKDNQPNTAIDIETPKFILLPGTG